MQRVGKVIMSGSMGGPSWSFSPRKCVFASGARGLVTETWFESMGRGHGGGLKIEKVGMEEEEDGEVAGNSCGSGKVCSFVSRTRQVFAIASFPRPRNQT